MSAEKVTELKVKGNAALAAGNNEEAIEFYTEAITLDPSNHVLYSNRSAAYAKMNKAEDSLKDAEKCIEIKPDFIKGYSRKGAALRLLDRTEDACRAYEDGLIFDPNNELLLGSIKELKNSTPAGIVFLILFTKNKCKLM
ncbi:hypothetical protein GJ496_010456 [Pomphorhynchus laevis]|nr:hypothetical protein GJ496_010456 [Pomphorhynchus laevis]